MSTIYSAKGHYDEAFYILDKALQITKSKNPDDFASEISIGAAMGKIHFQKGEFENAVACYMKSLELSEMKQGAKHPTNAFLYEELAKVYEKSKEKDNALSALGRSLKLTKMSKVPNKLLADLYFRLAEIYNDMGEYRKAKQNYADCLEARVKKFGLKDRETVQIFRKAYEMCEKHGIDKQGIDEYQGEFHTDKENLMGTDEGIRNSVK